MMRSGTSQAQGTGAVRGVGKERLPIVLSDLVSVSCDAMVDGDMPGASYDPKLGCKAFEALLPVVMEIVWMVAPVAVVVDGHQSPSWLGWRVVCPHLLAESCVVSFGGHGFTSTAGCAASVSVLAGLAGADGVSGSSHRRSRSTRHGLHKYPQGLSWPQSKQG